MRPAARDGSLCLCGKKSLRRGSLWCLPCEAVPQRQRSIRGVAALLEKTFLDSASRLQIKLYLRAKKNARAARRVQHILRFALGQRPTKRALCLGAKKRSGRTTTVQVASREKNASSVPFRASGGSPDVCLTVRNKSPP